MPNRILVTGSREFTDRAIVLHALYDAVKDYGDTVPVIVHGDCLRGADRLAKQIAQAACWPTEPHPANWDRYGKGAGFRRNAEMAAAGADVCLAFFRAGAANRGTGHCVMLAEMYGIPVRRFDG